MEVWYSLLSTLIFVVQISIIGSTLLYYIGSSFDLESVTS